MPTVVYSNTDLPMKGADPIAQLHFPFMKEDKRVPWQPAYVILRNVEKGGGPFKWISWKLYQWAKPEADKLVAEFLKEGRWGKRSYNVCRWRKDLCQAILDVIHDGMDNIRCSVEYPPFEENHCRVFTLVR